MHTSNDTAVKALNSLIETTLDSANGYREAAENIDAPDLRTMFTERAAKRQALVRQLQGEVRSFGGEPEDDQSFLGKAHNRFVDLKNAITGGSDQAVVNEVERGEDFIKAKFAKTLEDAEIPTTARQVIESALQEIRRDHDTISALKHRDAH
jgi:uncharacterized protein (TIGR02284 family)